MTKAFYL